jgi:hypothetical protein
MDNSSIRFLHYRNIDSQGNVDSRSGATVAYIPPTEGKPIVWAGSFCHPNDNYNKHMGRIKAAGRLKSSAYLEVTDHTDNKEFLADVDVLMSENDPPLTRKYSRKAAA